MSCWINNIDIWNSFFINSTSMQFNAVHNWVNTYCYNPITALNKILFFNILFIVCTIFIVFIICKQNNTILVVILNLIYKSVDKQKLNLFENNYHQIWINLRFIYFYLKTIVFHVNFIYTRIKKTMAKLFSWLKWIEITFKFLWEIHLKQKFFFICISVESNLSKEI